MEILYAVAAVATITGFALNVWLEYKRTDDGGTWLRRRKPKHKKNRH